MSENDRNDDDLVHPDPQTAMQVRELATERPRESVARKLGISLTTLKTHYEADYVLGQDEGEATLMAKLFNQGKAGNANAAWKWMARKGLTVPERQPGDVPGRKIGQIDLSRLNDDQLEQYGRLAAIAEGLDPDAIIIEPRPGG